MIYNTSSRENEFLIKPIGFVSSSKKYRYETSRQGVLETDELSHIKLLAGNNFEQALTGIEGFERLWIVFGFHLNPNWKPMVTPPRHTRKKVGIFATRSPHRPNQLGISSVKLIAVEGLQLTIGESDILDGSPVFDIKPYLPYSDSFPGVATGWVNPNSELPIPVLFSEKATTQTEWLQNTGSINLKSYAKLQLEFAPNDVKRKRIEQISASRFILAYRTWRVHYSIQPDASVFIDEIKSGYSSEELNNALSDKYADKELHRAFLELFG